MPTKPKPPVNELGAIIREARLAMRYSQEEVAQMFGHKKQTVSLWERGLRRPSSDDVVMLAVKLTTSEDAREVLYRRMFHAAGYALPQSQATRSGPEGDMSNMPETSEGRVAGKLIDEIPDASTRREVLRRLYAWIDTSTGQLRDSGTPRSQESSPPDSGAGNDGVDHAKMLA